LLKYSITNPKRGANMLIALQQSQHDKKQDIHTYSINARNVVDFLKIIFPSYEYTLSELKNQTADLEQYITNFFAGLEKEEYPSKKKPYPVSYSLNDQSGLLLYAICKTVKPDKIIETGVAYGLSSSYILKALDENNKGTLYSIDATFKPWESEQMIGSAIPGNLKKRWKLIFGTSSEKLVPLLKSLGTIDIFFHDSLHTYKNMIFEYEAAWQHIKNGGLLFSDDILGNDAFYDFNVDKKTKSFILSSNTDSSFGVLLKNI
jgi:predicted O-methyltransferase YrrM